MVATTSGSGHETVKNPGTLKISAGFHTSLVFMTIAGVLMFMVALLTHKQDRAWNTFLINHFYFFSLAIGGAFFASIQWLTGAMWSTPIRRVSESFTAYLPVAFITFLVLALAGNNQLYDWTHLDHVQGDPILEGKASYLNLPFFIIRNILGLAILTFMTWKMIGNSVSQDTSKSYLLTLKNRGFAPVFLICFAIFFTMASFDQLMSLDPHWFSTMFGVYCFGGLFYSTLALTCILTIFLKRKGLLEGIVNENHLHDLGKFMFAFTVFWAYIGFSQFMLIWYANLPEETGYYMTRMSEGWMAVSLFLLLGKFMLPFFVLIKRDAKRNENVLLGIGIFMMIAQWVDVMWMVQPETFKSGPVFCFVELIITIGFWGAFGLAVTRFLGKNNVVAIGDPRLVESVYHHHQ